MFDFSFLSHHQGLLILLVKCSYILSCHLSRNPSGPVPSPHTPGLLLLQGPVSKPWILTLSPNKTGLPFYLYGCRLPTLSFIHSTPSTTSLLREVPRKLRLRPLVYSPPSPGNALSPDTHVAWSPLSFRFLL